MQSKFDLFLGGEKLLVSHSKVLGTGYAKRLATEEAKWPRPYAGVLHVCSCQPRPGVLAKGRFF